MKREPERLANEQFDVLVVGAGIYGSTVAAAAAEQGLRVALIDKGDFGHATSANSQKIIHGGLRYLQHLNFKRMRESIAARRQLMAVAPHLVRPLQCVVPTRGHGLRSKAVMAAALAINDLVSWDRNGGMDTAHRLPRGQTVSAPECLRMIPGLNRGDVTGGAVWFDAMATNTERVTLAFVASAAAHGACVANYIEAVGYLEVAQTVCGVAAKDMLNGNIFDLRASVVVNAMGPGSGSLSAPGGGLVPGLPRTWCRAMNIVLNRRLFGDYAVGLTAGAYVDRDAVLNKGTRDFFFAPWRESTIVGTFYDRSPKPGHKELVDADDIHRMLREINSVYPPANLKPSDVGFVHAGLLPEAPHSQGLKDVQLLKHPVVVDAKAASGVPGLLSVVGVKYTTAPRTAQRIVRALKESLSWPPASTGAAAHDGDSVSSTAGSLALEKATAAGIVPPVTVDRLRDCYGTKLSDLLGYLGSPDGGRPLCPDGRLLAGEVIYAVHREMAQKLSDVVFRRTGLGAVRYPGRSTLLRCADVMAAEHGWTPQRATEEIAEVEQTYSALFDADCIERPGPQVHATADKIDGIANYRS